MKLATCSLLYVVALSACTVKRSAADLGVLRYPLGADPATLDPSTADTGIAVFVLNQVTSTLFEYDEKLALVNYDAAGYEWRAGGKTLFVQVRSDLLWSDGAPVTACQYRDGILRSLDPQVPSALSEMLFELKGARERKGGKGTESAVAVRCNDAKAVLEFDLVRPRSFKMLHALAFVVSVPIRKEAVLRRGAEWLLPEDGRPGLASGAFQVQEWSRDRRVTLRARADSPTLAADRRAKLREISFPIVRDSQTALSLYESGEVDVLEDIPSALITKIEGRPDHLRSSYFTTYMIGFSLAANPVLNDPRVRRALALSYHQEELPQLLRGGEIQAAGWVPPGLLPENRRPAASLFDPEKARSLLKEAGFPGGAKFPKLKLVYNSGERHKLLMERAANNWKTHLGIGVELEPIEWKVLVSQLKQKAPDLWRYAWTAAYPDPVFFLELYLSDSLNNFGKWKNAEYDRLVRGLLDTPFESRNEKFWAQVARAQEILVREDPALIPAYHYVRNALVRPGVYGLSFNGRGPTLLKNVERR